MTIFLEWVTHGPSNCAACDYMDGFVAPAEEYEVFPGFHNHCDCTLEPFLEVDAWKLLKPKRFFSWSKVYMFVGISLNRMNSLGGVRPFPKDMNPHSPDNMIPVHDETIYSQHISPRDYFSYAIQGFLDIFRPPEKKKVNIQKRDQSQNYYHGR